MPIPTTDIYRGPIKNSQLFPGIVELQAQPGEHV